MQPRELLSKVTFDYATLKDVDPADVYVEISYRGKTTTVKLIKDSRAF